MISVNDGKTRIAQSGCMITIEQLSPKAHRISIMGAFHQDDAKQIVAFAKEGGGGNVLFDLTSLADFSLAAVSEELVHLPALFEWVYSLGRIAVISDEGWLRTASRLESALLPGVEYQVYDDDETEAALAWITGASDRPHEGAFHEIDVGHPEIAAYELSGRLTREESERGVAAARARFDTEGCTRLLLVIKHWHGFDLDRLLSREILSGKLEMARKVERYAIVGGPKWLRTYAEFTGNFFPGEIRGFELGEQDAAVAWLTEEREITAAA